MVLLAGPRLSMHDTLHTVITIIIIIIVTTTITVTPETPGDSKNTFLHQ